MLTTFTKNKRNLSVVFIAMIVLSCIGMAKIIYPYLSWARNIDFLMTKQSFIHLDHYRLSFYIHIFSSFFVLLSGLFLFSTHILRHFPKVHRLSGRLYVGLLLFLSAPSGLVMACYANGGMAVKVSFFILTPLWWYFTFRGFTAIKNKQVKTHKKWMIRSYALTLSAISLRVYQLLLGYSEFLDPAFQYVLISWVSWLGNLIIAEIYIQVKYGRGTIIPFRSLLLNKIPSPMSSS